MIPTTGILTEGGFHDIPGAVGTAAALRLA